MSHSKLHNQKKIQIANDEQYQEIELFDKPGLFSKVTFGAEPKDYEIYEFVLKNYNGLRFSPAIETVIKEQTKNPKKLQREIHKSMSAKGIGTKSQQALQLQHEQCKQQRKAKSREEKVAEEKRLFELKQQKKKEKHRGR